jgi:hypothetical protein
VGLKMENKLELIIKRGFEEDLLKDLQVIDDFVVLCVSNDVWAPYKPLLDRLQIKYGLDTNTMAMNWYQFQRNKLQERNTNQYQLDLEVRE